MNFYGLKKDGKLNFFKRKTLDTFILSLKDGPFVLSLKSGGKKRTLPQNAYYWSVVIDYLRRHFGYEEQEMHDALRWQFLKVRSDDPKKPDTVKSTTDLSTKEFIEYLDTIIRWAAVEYGVVIPDPEEV